MNWLGALTFSLAICFAGCGTEEEPHDHEDHDHHEDGGHHHGDDAGNDHDHDHDGGTHDAGTDAMVSEAAKTYCDCMLLNCHDPFHDEWGESDEGAIPACREEASGWPVAGMPMTSGDSIECRQHFCEEASATGGAEQEMLCEQALGAGCTQ